MRTIENSRLKLIYVAIIIVLSLIIVRLFWIVLLNNKVDISKIYDTNKTSRRADIYDRNGVLVATDLKTKSLYISSVLIRDHRSVALGISQIFPELSYSDIYKKISESKNSKNWILIRRNLTPSQVEKVEKLQIAGLIFEDDLIRVYPQKSIASHYVGYVDLDRKGLSGIEMEYERQLRLNNNINLAMDIRIQDILYDELTKAVKEFNAKGAGGVVVNVNNGEVLALTSLPTFDANLQSDAHAEQKFNMITNGVYELGSVMKIFTYAIAFENGLINMDDKFLVRDPIKYGRFTLKDDHYYKDELTVSEIFSYSSNVGTIKIADKIGISLQKDFLTKIGFTKKVDTEFPGLGRPIYPKTWREINLYTISYGHGLAITPLHLVSAVSAIVNGGTLYKPSFLKLENKPSGKKIISENTSQMMRKVLRNAVKEGTGKLANVEGYEVGGKTGTAELAENGVYSNKQSLASFVATFPVSKPEYLICVILDRPNNIINTAGIVAAPVAGKIIKNIAPLLGIRPVNSNISSKN